MSITILSHGNPLQNPRNNQSSPPFHGLIFLRSSSLGMTSRNIGSILAWLLVISFIFLISFKFSPILSRHDQGLKWPLIGRAATTADGCDLFNGTWVRDEGGPSYTNVTCPTIRESNNCGKYGKDQDYINWRWKPDRCDVPRLDAGEFLDVVKGKKLAFVGDSVARNQMESLLCLLSQLETPLNIHKDAEDRFRTWHFPSHNFTLMTLWTKFLVEATERTINGSASGFFELQLDKVDTAWTDKLPGIDYIVISTSHWFFRKNYLYEGGKLIGCIYCSEENVTNLGVSFSVGRAFRTSLKFLSKCKECDGLLTVLRTFSPAHFESGLWDSGGYCNRTRPINGGDVSFGGTDWEIRNAQVEEMKRVEGQGQGVRSFSVLDVTKAMLMRPDGHPGTHWNNEWNRGLNDCVHWCMPGPIDMWNDLLLAILKKGGIDQLKTCMV